jgi:hypothetical protein
VAGGQIQPDLRTAAAAQHVSRLAADRRQQAGGVVTGPDPYTS